MRRLINILAVLASLFFVIFLIRGVVPPLNHVKLVHPDGFSIRVPKNVYACVDGPGFRVDLSYKMVDHHCVGPQPRRTKFQAQLVRTPRMGYTIAPTEKVPSLEKTNYCEAYFRRRTMFRYGKRARYSVCSSGGGSGGLEYSAIGFTRVGGKTFTGGAWTQTEWFAPSFKQAYRTLLTIREEGKK